MLRDIIRKEIIDNISSMKFVVTFVVVVVLIISGLTIGSRNYLEQRGDAQQQILMNRQMLESQNDWLSAGWMGVIETKKPYVLTTIDNGVDPSVGRQAEVDTLNQTRLDRSRNLVSPILAVFGDVDLTFVVKMILSLFVILLTYDGVSGEKERGTLKLALSNEVPRYRILLGKIIGGFSVIAIAFILPLLLGLAFMMGFNAEVLQDFNTEAWIRLGIIVGIYLLYLMVFFSLGLMVSAMTHRSSTSFIVLLMIWVLFVTIVPKISIATTERLMPYESYTTLQTKAWEEVSQKRADLWKELLPGLMQAQQRLSVAAIFPKEQADRILANMPDPGKSMTELRTEFWERLSKTQSEVMERYDREYQNQQQAQISVARMASRLLSPASAMSFAVENLAGSGIERQNAYLRQLRAYRQSFMQYIFGKAKQTKQETIWDLFKSPELDVSLDAVSFTFDEESVAEVLSRSLFDIAVLALMAIIFFLIASVMFIRYDVR